MGLAVRPSQPSGGRKTGPGVRYRRDSVRGEWALFLQEISPLASLGRNDRVGVNLRSVEMTGWGVVVMTRAWVKPARAPTCQGVVRRTKPEGAQRTRSDTPTRACSWRGATPRTRWPRVRPAAGGRWRGDGNGNGNGHGDGRWRAGVSPTKSIIFHRNAAFVSFHRECYDGL